MAKHKLQSNAVILDTETLGLTRGSAIHELATLDLDSGVLHEYILNPQSAVAQYNDGSQDRTKLASKASDHHVLMPGINSYRDAIQKELELANNTTYNSWKEVENTLAGQPDNFLWKNLQAGTYPHLMGAQEGNLEERARALGVKKANLGIKTSLSDLLHPDSQFVKGLEGKTIWGMNVAFDSKQLGAHTDALANAGHKVGLKHILETQNPNSPDPLYVTGVEVNKARVAAQVSGDYTGLWKAYNKHTPKPGETAVRDIQDVARAFLSYGQKLGFLDKNVGQHGTSLDFMYRLLGSGELNPAEAAKRVNMKEVHRAAEDIALHSSYVLDKLLGHTTLLEEIAEGGGKDAIAAANKGEGALFEVMKVFENYKKALPTLEEKAVRKRLMRAQQDIATDGHSVQVTHLTAGKAMSQVDMYGNTIAVDRPNFTRRKIRDLGTVAEFIDNQPGYSHSSKTARQLLGEMNNPGFLEGAGEVDYSSWLGAKGSVPEALQRASGKVLNSIPSIPGRTVAHGAGVAALGVSLLAFMGDDRMGLMPPKQQENRQRSVIVPNYQSWSGLQKQGIAASTRKGNTDFGSPYQGIHGSENVFIDQEFIKEREKYLNKVYGANNDQALAGVYGLFSSFSSINKGYNYITNLENTETRPGLRGDVKRIDANNYRVEVEDADTVTLKDKGLISRAKDLLGIKHGYAFRLAGLDSPETSHGGSEAQPHAEASKMMLQKMIQGKNLELLVNPEDTTYGRMLGVLYADGQNLNTELVRKGAAAALPFGKWEDSMIEYKPLIDLENKAYEANRGMWQTPWARAYKQVTDQTGQEVTFNTFARKDKVAENPSLMRQLSFMQESQRSGVVNSQNAQAVADRFSTYSDDMRPGSFNWQSKSSDNYFDLQKSAISQLNKTQLNSRNNSGLSHRGEYGSLSEYQNYDSLNSASSNVWNRRKYSNFERYNTQRTMQREKKERQATMQRAMNQQFGNSAQAHHRM